MALESPIERVKTAVAAYCGSRAPTADQTLDYIRRVLEFDFPELLSGEFAAIDRTWSFRAMDEADFRLLTNATLDDTFKVKEAGTPAVVETEPLELNGKQCALGLVSYDSGGTGEITFDLCLDADLADETAGSWLVADEGKTLTFAAEAVLDIYPSVNVVVRVSIAGGIAVRAVRLRLTLMGAGSLSKYTRVAALLAAAYWYDYRWNEAVANANSPDVQKALEYRAVTLRKQALGLIAPEQVPVAASAVQVSAGGANAYYERLKGIWAKKT